MTGIPPPLPGGGGSQASQGHTRHVPRALRCCVTSGKSRTHSEPRLQPPLTRGLFVVLGGHLRANAHTHPPPGSRGVSGPCPRTSGVSRRRVQLCLLPWRGPDAVLRGLRSPRRVQGREGPLAQPAHHLREDPRERPEGNRDVRLGHPADPEPIQVPGGRVQPQVCWAPGLRGRPKLEEQR